MSVYDNSYEITAPCGLICDLFWCFLCCVYAFYRTYKLYNVVLMCNPNNFKWFYTPHALISSLYVYSFNINYYLFTLYVFLFFTFKYLLQFKWVLRTIDGLSNVHVFNVYVKTHNGVPARLLSVVNVIISTTQCIGPEILWVISPYTPTGEYILT